MAKLREGDVVYLKITFDEGVVSEVISEKDYFSFADNNMM